MSLSWYKLLELGRANRPSRAMLERVADALSLTAFERRLVLALAAGIVHQPPRDPCIGAPLRQVIELAEPNPAYVCNARWDVLAWNRPTCAVFVDLDALVLRERNLLRILYRDPVIRSRMPSWAACARRAIAVFRAARLTCSEPRWFDEVISELRGENLEFRSWWDQHEVQECLPSQDHVDHPVVGRLVLDSTPFRLAHDPSLFLVMVTPDPRTDSHAKLARLQQRPPRAASSCAISRAR